jgi:predicted GNAT family acetyltransferase
MARIEVDAFGSPREIAEAFLSPGLIEHPGTSAFLALEGDEAVAMAYTQEHEGALGVFGVATLPTHRRRGIGGAVTAFAVREAGGADVAWLQSSEMGRPVYERLGFRVVADWEVWVEADPR